jgi:hypothetical protein
VSPKVSITIGAGYLDELLREPKVRCTQALTAARARGYVLRRRLGVICGLSDWRVDRNLQPTGVSLVGAVLLALQPEPHELDSPVEAAARALGVSLAWVEGADAGWVGELMDVRRLAALDASLYLDGFEAGSALLADFGYGRRR